MKGLSNRELCKRVEAAGGVYLRTKGDHRIYRLSSGVLFIVPMSGRQREVSIGVLRTAKRHGIDVF